MTVGELIETLKQYPQDLKVKVEDLTVHWWDEDITVDYNDLTEHASIEYHYQYKLKNTDRILHNYNYANDNGLICVPNQYDATNDNIDKITDSWLVIKGEHW